MKVNTKFEIGDKAVTIDPNTLKEKEFVIDNMSVYINGGQIIVSLYERDNYTAYREDRCFATEDELIAFVTSPDAQ